MSGEIFVIKNTDYHNKKCRTVLKVEFPLAFTSSLNKLIVLMNVKLMSRRSFTFWHSVYEKDEVLMAVGITAVSF